MVAHPSPLWQSYLALLPAESDITCLLNFTHAEAEVLQVPELQVSPALGLWSSVHACISFRLCLRQVAGLENEPSPPSASLPCRSLQAALCSDAHLCTIAIALLQDEAGIQARWSSHLHAKYFSSTTGELRTLGLSDNLAQSLWAISLVRSRTFSGMPMQPLNVATQLWWHGLGWGVCIAATSSRPCRPAKQATSVEWCAVKFSSVAKLTLQLAIHMDPGAECCFAIATGTLVQIRLLTTQHGGKPWNSHDIQKIVLGHQWWLPVAASVTHCAACGVSLLQRM